MRRRRAFLIPATVAAAFAIGFGGAATYAGFGPDGTKTVVRQVTVSSGQAAADTTGLSVSDIYQRVNKGVVEITVTMNSGSQSPFGGGQEQQALGSGFVYDSEGHIVTNDHVVDGATSISVKFCGRETYNASSSAPTPRPTSRSSRSTRLLVLSALTLADSDRSRSVTPSSQSAARSGSRTPSRPASSAPSTGR